MLTDNIVNCFSRTTLKWKIATERQKSPPTIPIIFKPIRMADCGFKALRGQIETPDTIVAGLTWSNHPFVRRLDSLKLKVRLSLTTII